MKNVSRTARVASVAAALALTAAACGGDDAAGVSVEGAWARTSPMSVEAGAAYFEISSDEADVLVGASVDPSVAATVELHETQMMEMDDHGGDESMEGDAMDEGGAMEGMGDVMQMVEVGRIDLPAGETVALAPGGLHIMMLDLAEPLVAGETFDLTLDFETADDLVVTVEVRDSAPE